MRAGEAVGEVVPDELPVKLRFTAFNASKYGLVDADLVSVSADTQEDAKTGRPYYAARVVLRDSVAHGEPVRPGWSVQASVIVGNDRTILDYLVGPVSRLVQTAFRER